jgi:hypothetical protein
VDGFFGKDNPQQCAPLGNAHAERHVREMRETLDDLLLLGEAHLRRTLAVIEDYHNARRPHQGIGNVIPLGFDYPAAPALEAEIQCEGALGGLLNHYSIEKSGLMASSWMRWRTGTLPLHGGPFRNVDPVARKPNQENIQIHFLNNRGSVLPTARALTPTFSLWMNFRTIQAKMC